MINQSADRRQSLTPQIQPVAALMVGKSDIVGQAAAIALPRKRVIVQNARTLAEFHC